MRLLGVLMLLGALLGGGTARAVGSFPTTLNATYAPNPSVFTQPVLAHFAVYAAGTQAVLAGGTIDVYVNGSKIGTATVSSGQSDFPFTAPVGSNAVLAQYSGDSFYAPTSSTSTQVVDSDTSLSVTSASPSTYGQPVGLTASIIAVPPVAGIPTGSVNFSAVYSAFSPPKVVSIGSAPLQQGTAHLSVATLPAGSATIHADYVSDSPTVYSASSAQTAQTITPDATNITLTPSNNPSVFSQSITFTVGVTPVAPGTLTPSGTVTLRDAGSPLATLTLDSSGHATYSTAALAVGAHTISASYTPANDSVTGAADFITAPGPLLTQTVNADATSTTLATTGSPQVAGRTVTFTATVAATAPGFGTPSGSVTFNDGATVLGSVPLNSSGLAVFSTASLTVGSHSITATYGGSGSFNTSTSSALTEQIIPNTATVVTSSANPSAVGQSVVFTATVTGAAPCTAPTGSVVFSTFNQSLGTVALNSNGTATVTTASLPIGFTQVRAQYFGGGACTGSAGNVVPLQQVTPASSTVTLASSVNPSLHGQPVTFTANVNVVAPGATTATGTVTFMDGSTSLGTAGLDNNAQASITTSALTLGSHTITAAFAGSPTLLGSTGTLSGGQAVNPVPGMLSINANGPAFAQFGQAVTYTIQVTNTGELPVNALVVDDLPPQIVPASATWTCLPSPNAACGSGLTGNLYDNSMSVPGGGSVTYALSATIDHETNIGTDDFTQTASAVDALSNTVVSAPMSTSLVLFRDTFEAPSVPAPPVSPLDLRAGGDPLLVTLDASELPLREPVVLARCGEAGGDLFHVEALRIDASHVVARLVARDGDGERASAWSDARPLTLRVALSDDASHVTVALGEHLLETSLHGGELTFGARAAMP